MTSWLIWIGCGIVALVVAAAVIEAYLKRNIRRRLSDMRPDPETLKRRPWEADGVSKVHDENQRLEKGNWWLSRRMTK